MEEEKVIIIHYDKQQTKVVLDRNVHIVDYLKSSFGINKGSDIRVKNEEDAVIPMDFARFRHQAHYTLEVTRQAVEVQPVNITIPGQYTPNPTYERIIFDVQPLTEISYGLNIALDLAGQLVCDPQVTKLYIIQDRDLYEDAVESENDEIKLVLKHMRSSPPILLISEIPGKHNKFGGTPLKSNPTIFLCKELVDFSYPSKPFTQFAWSIILIAVIILHELSHWKVRRSKQRNSPSQFTWKNEVESGCYVEGQLLGGLLSPNRDGRSAEPSSYLPYTFNLEYQDGSEVCINHSWAERIVSLLITNKPINLETFRIKGDELLKTRYYLQQTTNTVVPTRCINWSMKISSADDPSVKELKSLGF